MTLSPARAITLSQSARWLPADTETPISLFMGMAGSNPGILLESAEVDGRWGRYSIVACDMAMFLTCRQGALHLDLRDERLAALSDCQGRPFLEGLREVLQRLDIRPPEDFPDLPPSTRALYGYLGFGMASLFNPHLAPVMPPEEAECALALPRTVLLFDHLYNRLCQISLGEAQPVRGDHSFSTADAGSTGSGAPELPPVTSRPDAEGYKGWVERIRAMLRQGEAIQVVPSVRFSMPFAGNAFDLYRRMRRSNASPYMFFMRFPDMTLFGASPEVMVRCTAGFLELSPIAGTRRRGRTDAEDEQLAQELLADPKERAEHVMLVDLGRNDLGRIAAPGSVRVARYMDVERFSHVMHLTSRVNARLDGDARHDALDVLAATFPAGTLAGAPKLRAIEIIRELEGGPRGPYAGCIGWIGLDHGSVNLDMGITIRSMWVKDGVLCWQAGGGIVHDSDPELEWKEVCNKSAIMRHALQREEKSHVSDHR